MLAALVGDVRRQLSLQAVRQQACLLIDHKHHNKLAMADTSSSSGNSVGDFPEREK